MNTLNSFNFDFKKEILTNIQNTNLNENKNSKWLEKPLSFKEFVESEDHLNFKTLSPRQLNFCYKLLYGCNFEQFEIQKQIKPDIYWVWENTEYNLAVWLAGKGSGKDLISSFLMAYLAYLFLIRKEPFKDLNVPYMSHIEMVNVSYDREVAKKSFFQYLKGIILNWPWLKRNFSIDLSGQSISQIKDKYKRLEKILVTSDSIIFPNRVNIYSDDSSSESYEALNIIFAFLSEFSAFKDDSEIRNSDKIFRTMREGASSRFTNKYKMVVASFPRYVDDPTWKLYKWSLNNLHAFGDHGATWEFRPRHLFSPENFEMEYEYVNFDGRIVKKTFQIPIDFYQNFITDPIDSFRKFCAIPPLAERPFIEPSTKSELIENLINFDVQQPIIFEDYVEGEFVKKRVKSVNKTLKMGNYVIGFDLGYKKCSAAVCVLHKEEEKIYIDLLEAWIPDPEKGLKVDIDNVEQIINTIKEYFKFVVGIYSDPWNSAGILIRMRSSSCKAEEVRLSIEDYERFRTLVLSKQIHCVKNKRFIDEIKSLQIKEEKVEKGEHMTKDLVDAVVVALKKLLELDLSKENLKGTYITENLSSYSPSTDLIFYNNNKMNYFGELL